MRTVEQRARDYAKQANAEFPEICAFDYIAGAKEEHILLTEWHDIESDKDGFITDAAWDNLFAMRPILVKNIIDNEYFVLQYAYQYEDWSSDLTTNPYNFKWRKIHE